MSTRQIARAELDFELELATLGAEPIAGRVGRIIVASENEAATCEVEVALAYTVYERALAEGQLGLDAPGSGADDLEEGRLVHTRLALRPYLVERVAATGEPLVETVTAALRAPTLIDLRHADAWRAIDVTQEVPAPPDIEGLDVVRLGYRTAWGLAKQASSQAPGAMVDVVRGVFDGNGVPFELIDPGIVRATLADEAGRSWVMLIRLSESDSFCVGYGVFPAQVPEERRQQAALSLVSVNYELPLGAFEMDPEDGEVRFRTGIDVGDGRLSADAFERMFAYNAAIMEAHLGLLADLCAASDA